MSDFRAPQRAQSEESEEDLFQSTFSNSNSGKVKITGAAPGSTSGTGNDLANHRQHLGIGNHLDQVAADSNKTVTNQAHLSNQGTRAGLQMTCFKIQIRKKRVLR